MRDIRWKEPVKDDINNFKEKDNDKEEVLHRPYKDKSGLGIFSEEQKWFRCEKYEVCDYKGHVYIKPVEDAELEEYSPYDEYPQILEVFFSVVDRMLNKIFEKRNSGSSGITINPADPVDIRENHQLLIDCANILIEFYNKYGPLGVFFEDILTLRIIDYDRILVFRKENTFFSRNKLFFSNEEPTINEKMGIFEYEKYSTVFFPWLTQIPQLYEQPNYHDRLYDNDYRLASNFMKHYSEEMNLILSHELLQKLYQVIETIKEFDLYGTQAENTAGAGTLFLDVGFPGVSNPIMNSYMLTLIRDEKHIKIGWKANSLMGILILLFLENLTKQRKGNLTVCKYEECMRLVSGKTKYCLDLNCKSLQNQRDWNRREAEKKREEKEKKRQSGEVT